MKKKINGVTTWTLKELSFHVNTTSASRKDGRWGPVRPLGNNSLWYRLKAAYRVFTCKADVLVWPEDN